MLFTHIFKIQFPSNNESSQVERGKTGHEIARDLAFPLCVYIGCWSGTNGK